MDEELELQGEEMAELPQPVARPIEVDKEAVKDAFSIDMREDLSDLTSMSDEDRAWAFSTAGIDEVDDEEELDDLFTVTEEDMVGDDPVPPPQPKPRYRIPLVRRYPPTTPMGGMQS